MTNEPLDELYFKWLYYQIGSVRYRDPERTYWSLAKKLYTTEFLWFVPNDDNRVEDGKDLRHQFIFEEGLEDEDLGSWMGLGCSMLEMLIAISRKLSFLMDGEPREWFWHLMANIKLDGFNDASYSEPADRYVHAALKRVIERTYRPDGEGGLFPLRNADRDQRQVELWYQMNSYIIEME